MGYLLHTFQKRIDIAAADKYLSSFKTQKPKQTCGTFIDLFMTKFEYYITVRWSATERMAPGFRTNVDQIRLQYIRDGLCKEFRKHLDANLNIITQQQVDDEIQRWTRQKLLTLHPPYMQTPKISRQKKRKYPKNFHQPHQAIRAKEVEHIEAGVA